MQSSLPIYELESALIDSLKNCPRLLLEAPTGSGKSTQVPQMLDRAGFAEKGQIVVLQPRRLPTRMLSARVASEMKVRLGDDVGYQIRFEDVTSSRTRIRFLTEGLLLRQMMSDPALSDVAVILFDEFHERHLSTDLGLALAREIQRTRRPDLRLVVMSATLGDSTALSTYLDSCPILRSDGRMFPVSVSSIDRDPDFSKTPIWEVTSRHTVEMLERHEGDALVFLPGVYEIQRTAEMLRARLGAKDYDVLPLYGELPPQQQDAVVAPSSRRKVIVSTNVAETSLTIDGIRIIIDSGLARTPRFDANRGLDTLWIEKISRASADQRAGRAGRTAPGVCLRLWTERDHMSRPEKTLPEIHRVDLAETLLLLHASGVTDPRSFPWLEPPATETLQRAENLLTLLGALDESGKLTPMGQQMAKFPLPPRLSRMLLAAAEYGCLEEASLCAALVQERSILRRPSSKADEQFLRDLRADHPHSDIEVLTVLWKRGAAEDFNPRACEAFLVHAMTAKQVDRARRQFLQIAQSLRLKKTDAIPDALRKVTLLAFPDRVALRLDGGTLRCRLADGRVLELDNDSAVRQDRLVVGLELREIMTSRREVRTVLATATGIEEKWLTEFFPHAFKNSRTVEFDATTRRVIAREQTTFGNLVLTSKELPTPRPEDAAPLLAAKVLDGTCPLKEWNDDVDQWIMRVNCLSVWMPELEIQPIRETDRPFLIEQVCMGAVSYKEIKDKPVLPIVQTWLSRAHLAALESLAPSRFELPGGYKAKITYRENQPPVLNAKIQQLFGVDRSLTIAGGKVKLLIEILAPNFRPVQVTDDLARFWKETYPELRTELKRRYPKHEWR